MTPTHKKKLIEVAIPLEAINAASVREKSIRHGHPCTLHLWWARRPLATCRAVLFAQLVDDPAGYADTLLDDAKFRTRAKADLAVRLKAWRARKVDAHGNMPDTPEPTLKNCAADIERKRLFAIIEELVKWENSTNGDVLARARAEIRRCCGDELPPVCDPFSGGGSIPLEAARLGLGAFGSDLNPVAVMIGKALIELPARFRDKPPVHPGIREGQFYRNAAGLAEDVSHYAEWMREQAFGRIGHLYPQVDLPGEYGGGKATAIAWLWARTVPSPDPAFSGVQVPLVSSFVLSSKKGKQAWVEPVVDRGAGTITWRIRKDGTEAELDAARFGTGAGRRQGFRCLLSGAAIPYDHIRKAGKSGNLGQTLIAIVAEGKGGRVYLDPSQEHARVAGSAKPGWRPEASLPDGALGFRTSNYGLDQWGKLFTDRQLVALTTFSGLVAEARARARADGLAAGLSPDPTPLRCGGTGARAYAEAVSVYLGFIISKVADYGSSICSWETPGEKIRNTFARQAIPMVWDFAEANPFSGSSGCWTGMTGWVCKALGAIVPADSRHNGAVVQHDAQTVSYPGNAVISTDPPYYDNIGYGDLSDFFLAWLKPALGPVYPEMFATLAAPKTEELVAAPYRHGGRAGAEKFFLDGMSRAVANMAAQSRADFPTVIYYAFKQREIRDEGIYSTGWATFLQAVIAAGYAIVGTWPMRTELANRANALGTNALANSVILVCRRRDATAGVIGRAEFIRTLKRELPPAIAGLQAANIAPTDMPQAAIGPGIGVYSRHAAVLESDDNPMGVKTALQLINAGLDEYLGGIQGEFDPDTRFAITWFEQHGMKSGDYGVADNLARARGISVDSVKHAGIVSAAAGKVRILNRDELDPEWEPQTDTRLTVWECLQYLVRQHEKTGLSPDTALLLRKIDTQAGAVKDLAYCLYDICARRHEASEAIAYNALIADWAELTKLAAAIHDTSGPGQKSMDL